MGAGGDAGPERATARTTPLEMKASRAATGSTRASAGRRGDNKLGPLVEERGRLGTYRVHITAAGRALYERECAQYLELYPRLGVIQPRAALGH